MFQVKSGFEVFWSTTFIVPLQNTSEVPLPLKKGSKIAQILIKPVHMGTVEEIPKPSALTGRVEGRFGSTDKSGAKVWVEQHDGPPKSAEIIAMGQDNTVAVMEPGEERWRNVPANKCYHNNVCEVCVRFSC